MILQERRSTPSEPESLALIAIQQKGLIKAAEATRQEAREARLAAHEAKLAASEAHDKAITAHDLLVTMREWQEQHSCEVKPLFDALPELLQIAQSLRWILTGRAVVLWLVGGVIALGATVAALHTMWETFVSHRGP